MIYVEAPDVIPSTQGKKILFLAGTIRNSSDWQSQLIEKIKTLDIVVYNPRRKYWPEDPNAAIEQIKWEYQHLQDADIISFWFAKTSISPITLFELGSWIKTTKLLAVGIEPGYPRELDVIIQTGLEQPDLRIFRNLDHLANEIFRLMNQLSSF